MAATQYYCETPLAIDSFRLFASRRKLEIVHHEEKFYKLAAGIYKKA